MGVGPPDPETNPFLSAEIPTLRALCGHKIFTRDPDPPASSRATCPEATVSPASSVSSVSSISSVSSVAIHLDPLLGVEGIPQSGTGQTALLTGENAAALYGRHFGPWVPVPLRGLLREKNVLSRARAEGATCVFANAYPRQYHELAWSKRPAAPPLAAHGAGLLMRHEGHLARGDAISSEILNSAWRTRLGLVHVPEITPQEAGGNLGRIASGADLTFFAHYATDTAGHEKTMPSALAALKRVDLFLKGLVSEMKPDTLLVLASDHGNIEDTSRGHTLNPVLGVIAGPGARELASGASSIKDIPGLILRALDLAEA